MTIHLDVLIATYQRPAALAVTLTSLCAQTLRGFRLVVSDETEAESVYGAGEVQAVLRAHGQPVETHCHLPRRGIAEQRQFLLERAVAPYALFLDDDLILESDTLARLARARCPGGDTP